VPWRGAGRQTADTVAIAGFSIDEGAYSMFTTSLRVYVLDTRMHWRIVMARALCFLMLRIILMSGVEPADLACGLIADAFVRRWPLSRLTLFGGLLTVAGLSI
jgi:multicomponent Na+:H+ antiporter subunit E